VSPEWHELVDRLAQEASRRGGTAVEDLDVVILQPPQDSGEPVRVLRYVDESGNDQTVFIECGFAFRHAVSLNGEDGPEWVATTVVAILDGHAYEAAQISKDDTWLHVVHHIDTPGDEWQESTHLAPAFRLREVPVDHEHRRQIEPWPKPAGSETFPPS
jgi:hypothetical protein